MISWFKGLVMGWLAGVFTVVAVVGTHHIIRAESGLALVARESWGFQDSYVDTRSWGAFDYAHHQQLSKDLVRAGVKDLAGAAEQAASDTRKKVSESLDQAKQALGHGIEEAREAARRALDGPASPKPGR